MSTGSSLVVIAPGFEAYRRYHLEALAASYHVRLVTSEPVDWARGLVEGQTIVPDYDPRTVDAALRADRIGGSAAGVLAWDEGKIICAAAVSRALGLPGPSVAAVAAVRDKARTRALLARARIAQPRFAVAGSLAAARAAADWIGYPVVVKPRGGAASYGVCVVDDAGHLDDALHRAMAVRFGRSDVPTASVLVEQCVIGPEISIDSAIDRGNLTMVAVARKQLGFPPMCEEVGHVVDGGDPLLRNPGLRSILCRTHKALGFTHGWTHTELKLSPSGPQVIEVNGRLGGDLIPYLASRATGIDLTLAAAALATGRRPSLRPSARRTAAIRFLYPHPDTIGAPVHRARFDARAISGRDLAVALVSPGDAIPAPSDGLPERVGFVVAVSDTTDRCAEILDETERGFIITTAADDPSLTNRSKACAGAK